MNGIDIPTGSLSVVGPSFDNSYDAIAAIDYNLSDRDQIRGRFIYNKVEGLDTNAQLPTFYAPEPTRNYLTSVSEFHNFSPTLQNEFRAAFNRNFNSIQTGQFTFPGLTAFPNITIDDLNSTQIGTDRTLPPVPSRICCSCRTK